MCALLNQDLSQYSAQDFTPIPAGEYDFEINDTQVADTKTGKRMIKASCKVLGPTQIGRVVFENFLIGQEVAMIRLKTMATMAGHPRPDYIQDTQELHGLKFRANVGVKEDSGYGPQNYIKTFKKIPAPTASQGYQPGPQYPAAPPQYPQAPQGGYQQPPQQAFPPHSTPAQNAVPPMTPPPVMQPPLQPPPAPGAQTKPAAPWLK